jgi:outer membrane protein OmpA-like peptidoglycan-associated protein
MRHAIIHGLAQAAVVVAALSAFQAAGAQMLIPVRGASGFESFAPAAGIPGAVPNYAAYGLNPVQVNNGVPMGGVAGPLADASRDVLPFSGATTMTTIITPSANAQPVASTVVSRSSTPERVILSKSSMSPTTAVSSMNIAQSGTGPDPASYTEGAKTFLGEGAGSITIPASETILIGPTEVVRPSSPRVAEAAVLSGQPHCQGFALTSDGALIATGGTGYQAMIIGADCETLIRAALEAGHGVIFSASVLFSGSSDTISAQAERALEMTAIAINASTGRYDVVGYASLDGTDYVNKQIALKRAKAAAYFLTQSGVRRAKLDTAGRGGTRMFGPEPAVNRRVVIRRKSS